MIAEMELTSVQSTGGVTILSIPIGALRNYRSKDSCRPIMVMVSTTYRVCEILSRTHVHNANQLPHWSRTPKPVFMNPNVWIVQVSSRSGWAWRDFRCPTPDRFRPGCTRTWPDHIALTLRFCLPRSGNSLTTISLLPRKPKAIDHIYIHCYR